MQPRKSLNYQLWNLRGDPKEQITQIDFLTLFHSLRQDQGLKSDSVIVTFLFLLLIAHLEANGI